MKKLILAFVLSLFSSISMAHPGHGLESAYAGFMHPLTGLDHLLVMLAVGMWAAKIGGKARWQLPLAFLMAMIFGAVLGFVGVGFNGLETAIAASLLAVGFLVTAHLPMRNATCFALVAIFAAFHGLAHGAELTVNQTVLAMGGMLLSTAMLHGLGLMLGTQRFQFAKWLSTGVAWLMMVLGSYLLLS